MNQHDPKITNSQFFDYLPKIQDIAGLRLTIATKDLYDESRDLIEKSIKDIGDIIEFDQKRENRPISREKQERIEQFNLITKKLALTDIQVLNFWPIYNEIADKTENESQFKGYIADHYVIRSKSKPHIVCELQVRSLTQDLWAVFTHQEQYKSKIGADLDEEILCYSRLLEVADDYARIIRLKKISAANQLHRQSSPAKTPDNELITVEILQRKFYIQSYTHKDPFYPIPKLDTVKLCTALTELHKLNIYTIEDFNEVWKCEIMIKELIRIKNKKLDELGYNPNDKDYKGPIMDILDAFKILSRCRNYEDSVFKNGDAEISKPLIHMLKSYTDVWILENTLESSLENLGDENPVTGN